MDTIGAYLDSTGSTAKEDFLKANPSFFLVTVEEQRGQPAPFSPGADVGQAATVYQSRGGMRQASIAAREARVYIVAKRAAANSSPDILVGRSRDNDLIMEDAEVSKRHARFRPMSGGLDVADLGSTNGTFVNDKRLERDAAAVLKPNDWIRFGRAAKLQLLDADSFFEYLELLRRFVGL